MSNNKDIETNTNENTQKSETPKKKNIVHVIRPQNAQNGGNKGRRSGGNRSEFRTARQGKPMQVKNGRPARRSDRLQHRMRLQKKHRLQRGQRSRQQKEHRTDVRKEVKDRRDLKEMKDLIETTDPITEITVVVKDVAEETGVTVTARKEEADRVPEEETARRRMFRQKPGRP